MTKKIQPAAEVHYSPNAGGYYVLNRRYRINRACTHLFASREDALAFANTASLFGWRTALSQLKSTLAAAAAAEAKRLTAVKDAERASKPTHVWVGTPVKKEAPPVDDLIDAFGAEAVRSAERSRLVLLLEGEARPQYRRHYMRLLRKLNAA